VHLVHARRSGMDDRHQALLKIRNQLAYMFKWLA
jgi:hypothetical protein